MTKIITTVLLLTVFSGEALALNPNPANSWILEANFGLTDYAGVAPHAGHTATGRLGLGRTLLSKPSWQVGFEVGAQSGNSMRLDLPKESIEILGGVPIQATMKPLLDGLLGAKAEPFGNFPMIMWLKGGMAYRSLQLDRPSVSDLKGLAPEAQLGFGYRINPQTTVNMGYQKIWGKKPVLMVNPPMETGVLRYIPAEEAIMIGFSFNFK